MLGKIEGRRGQQRKTCLDGITDSVDMNVGKLQEMARDREAWHAAVHGVTELDTWQLNNNTTIFLWLPQWLSGERIHLQCKSHRRCGFDPWVGKIPWRGKWQPTLAFLPEKVPWTEETGGLQSMDSQRVGYN